MLIQYSVNSDWLFSTRSRILQGDWFILEINDWAISSSFKDGQLPLLRSQVMCHCLKTSTKKYIHLTEKVNFANHASIVDTLCHFVRTLIDEPFDT